jgi:hypothetical protein
MFDDVVAIFFRLVQRYNFYLIKRVFYATFFANRPSFIFTNAVFVGAFSIFSHAYKSFTNAKSSSQPPKLLLNSPPTYSQPPQPLLTVMRGFNLFSKPLLLSRRRGLTRKIAETVDFSLFWYRGTRDVFFLCCRLGASRGTGSDVQAIAGWAMGVMIYSTFSK